MKKFAPFTPAEYELLVAMKAEGKSWTEIGEAVGHSANSCCSTFCIRNRLAAAGVPFTGRYIAKGFRQPWPKADVERLLHLRDVEHKPFHEIDIVLERKPGCSRSKYSALSQAPTAIHGHPEPGSRVTVTPEALADRDARFKLKQQQSPAAALMGEPLPGRSALDMRRQGGAL